jgi:hypothetical protein
MLPQRALGENRPTPPPDLLVPDGVASRCFVGPPRGQGSGVMALWHELGFGLNQPPTDCPVSPPSQKLACRAALRRSRSDRGLRSGA